MARNRKFLSNGITWIFGVVFIAIGLINTFWGNDPFYGVFIVLLSLIFFPPLEALLKDKTGFKIPILVKILVGLFILWSSLGVGELPDKIDLMLQDF